MDNNLFIEICTEELVKYVKSHLDNADNVKFSKENVFVVWLSKTLQNNKCLMSTTLPDGMYYEFTYNGDRGQLYLDAYKKFENKCILVSLTVPSPDATTAGATTVAQSSQAVKAVQL